MYWLKLNAFSGVASEVLKISHMDVKWCKRDVLDFGMRDVHINCKAQNNEIMSSNNIIFIFFLLNR